MTELVQPSEQLISRLSRVVDILEEMTTLINESLEELRCKELQLALMDVISLTDHLTRLNDNGPTPAFIDVPLNDSEIDEEDPMWVQDENGIAPGDIEMTTGWEE